MNLHEWVSNSVKFLDGLPDDQKIKKKVLLNRLECSRIVLNNISR